MNYDFVIGDTVYHANHIEQVDTGKGYSHFRISGIAEPVEKPEPTTAKISVEEQIEKLICNFDFDKVQKVMLNLDWKWYDFDGTYSVPTVPKLVMCAQRLLKEVVEKLNKSNSKEPYAIATAGFNATAVKYEDDEVVLRLQFVLEDENYSSQDLAY